MNHRKLTLRSGGGHSNFISGLGVSYEFRIGRIEGQSKEFSIEFRWFHWNFAIFIGQMLLGLTGNMKGVLFI